MYRKLLRESAQRSTRDMIHFQVFSSFCHTDIKSDHLSRHPFEVAALARDIARELGLDALAQDIVYFAALNHDLGKFITPDDLIISDKKFNPIEFLVVKSHPLLSSFLVSGLPLFEKQFIFKDRVTSISEIIRYHHERYDGTGYEQKRGAEVPFASYIVMMADSFCAATEDKKARGYTDDSRLETVLARFESEQEKFHPEVYAAFQSVIRKYQRSGLTTKTAIKERLRNTRHECTLLPGDLEIKDICAFMDRLVQRQRQFFIPHNGAVYTVREDVEPYIIAQSGTESRITIERVDGSVAAELIQSKKQLDIDTLTSFGFKHEDFFAARRLLRYVGKKAEFTCLGYSPEQFETLLADTTLNEDLKKLLRTAWTESLASLTVRSRNTTPDEDLLIACCGYLPKINIRGTALDKVYAITEQFLADYRYGADVIEYITNCLRLSFFIEYIALLDEKYALYAWTLKKDVEQNIRDSKKKLAEFTQLFPYFKKFEKTILNNYDNTAETELDQIFFVLNSFFSLNGLLSEVMKDYGTFVCAKQFHEWLMHHQENLNPLVLKLLS